MPQMFKIKNLKFYPIDQFFYWIFINISIILTWLGIQVIELPFFILIITLFHLYQMIYSIILQDNDINIINELDKVYDLNSYYKNKIFY